MLYSGIFTYKAAKHPIPSYYQRVTGQETISTGLSRCFSAIVRLDFDQAQAFNVHGIRVFVFFLTQLIIRTALIILILNRKKIASFYVADVVFTVFLFLYCFYPFIRYTIYFLYTPS